ncbi:MAG: hypothetical protein II646_05305, partial [Firmicutes bacterium]|nr:hypothetical protein [Bacillota bacterium]
MKEISVKELFSYIDPFAIHEDPAIALATDGKETNGLTIGWAEYGVLWSKPAATVYVHKTRYSKHIFDGAEYYAICYLKPEHKNVLGYFGSVSGRDENKMEKCGLKTVTDDLAPYFAESRLVVICRVMGKNDFDPASV